MAKRRVTKKKQSFFPLLFLLLSLFVLVIFGTKPGGFLDFRGRAMIPQEGGGVGCSTSYANTGSCPSGCKLESKTKYKCTLADGTCSCGGYGSTSTTKLPNSRSAECSGVYCTFTPGSTTCATERVQECVASSPPTPTPTKSTSQPAGGGVSSGNKFPQCAKNPEYLQEGPWTANGICDPCTSKSITESQKITDCNGKVTTDTRSKSCVFDKSACDANQQAIDKTKTTDAACTAVFGCWITPSNVCIKQGASFDCTASGCYRCSSDPKTPGYIIPPGKAAAPFAPTEPECTNKKGCWNGSVCIAENTSQFGYCCAKPGENGNKYQYNALVPGSCQGETKSQSGITEQTTVVTECSLPGKWRCFFRGRRLGQVWDCDRVNGIDTCFTKEE